jgi:hypothetical protein
LFKLLVYNVPNFTKKEGNIMKNNLADLNNHLFEQLERLNDDSLDDGSLTKEIHRAKSMSDVAGKIIDNAKILLDAVKIKDEFLNETTTLPKFIAQK